MAKIAQVIGREVLDSRGTPTVAARVITVDGIVGEALIPSGAANGKHEAHELRDEDQKRYQGKGVLQAAGHVNVAINAAVHGMDTANQNKIDRRLIELDGTSDKSNLGANAILATSLAVARAEAAAQGLPLYVYLAQLYPKREVVLPVPHMNLVNGGAHASNHLAIQEFQIIPIGAPSFAEALRMGVEIYMAAKKLLVADGYQVEQADEGGYAPKFSSSEQVFTLLVRAIETAGYIPGVDAFLGIDAAAQEFFDTELGVYRLDGKEFSPHDLAYQYRTWRESFPLISIEDPFAEDAWGSWQEFTKHNGHAVQIVGDDLYATNVTRLQQGIKQAAANAILVKPNQIGTLTETLQTILLAQESGHGVIISHRSGETEDTFIADLAVAVGAGQIKTGAPARSERTAKYNRLLQIESESKGPLAKVLQSFLQHNQPRYQQAEFGAKSRTAG